MCFNLSRGSELTTLVKSTITTFQGPWPREGVTPDLIWASFMRTFLAPARWLNYQRVFFMRKICRQERSSIFISLCAGRSLCNFRLGGSSWLHGRVGASVPAHRNETLSFFFFQKWDQLCLNFSSEGAFQLRPLTSALFRPLASASSYSHAAAFFARSWDSTGGYNCKKLCTARHPQTNFSLRLHCQRLCHVDSVPHLRWQQTRGKKKILILCLLRLKQQLLVNSGNRTVERKDGAVEWVCCSLIFKQTKRVF